jgi:hypothetical protein
MLDARQKWSAQFEQSSAVPGRTRRLINNATELCAGSATITPSQKAFFSRETGQLGQDIRNREEAKQNVFD